MRVVIAADLGGTFFRTALVTAERSALHEVSQRVGDHRGNAAVAAFLQVNLQRAYTEACGRSFEPVAVGVAVPGLVDPAAGVLRYSGNLDLRDLPVATVVGETVPLPVVVENDVRAAAWGEWLWGAGQGASHPLYLSAGTGIAAAVIIDGHLYRGATAAAGELGHAPVVPDGDTCRCGRRGCLETVAGGWGIARRAGMPTAEAVFKMAAAGDAAAAAVITDAGRFLAQAAMTAIRLWNPDCVILGGGLFHDGSPLIEAVRAAVSRSALHDGEPPPVRRAAFGDHSGLMGAACLVLAAGREGSAAAHAPG
jgi:glucokinase